MGGGAPSQEVTLTSISGAGHGGELFFTTALVMSPGENWLSVDPTSETTPETLTISVNTAGLAADSYVGLVSITDTANNAVLVSVGLTVSAPTPPVVTAIADDSVVEGVPYTGPTPSLSSGTQPVTWSLAAGPAGMSIQSGTGVVSWANPVAAGSPHTITIRATNSAGSDDESWMLTVSSSTVPEIALSPGSLTFIAAPETNPPTQTFEVQNAGTGTLGWSATAADSGGNWLSVSPLTGTAPSTLTVAVNSAGLAEGTYAGTITVAALEGSNAANSPQVLAVSLAVGAPVIGQNGIVNGASFSQEAVNSPGSIVSLFGVNLATGTALAAELPLPTELLGTQVLVNEVPAPLFFVSPLQINFQIPPGVSGTSLQAVVVLSGVRGLTATVNVAPEVPGIFTTTQQGAGQGAVLLANSDVIAAPVGSIPGRSTRPAARGEIVSIFCTGLGAVDPPVEAGQPAGGSPPSVTVTTPVVLVGGVPGEVLFSGLAPGFVGLYQVNVRIPEAAPVGDAVSLQIQIGGQSSNTATIAVE